MHEPLAIFLALLGLLFVSQVLEIPAAIPPVEEVTLHMEPVTAVGAVQTAFAAQPLTLWLFVFALLAIIAVFFSVYLITSSTQVWRLRNAIEQRVTSEVNVVREHQVRFEAQLMSQLIRTENLRDVSSILVPLTHEKKP